MTEFANVVAFVWMMALSLIGLGAWAYWRIGRWSLAMFGCAASLLVMVLYLLSQHSRLIYWQTQWQRNQRRGERIAVDIAHVLGKQEGRNEYASKNQAELRTIREAQEVMLRLRRESNHDPSRSVDSADDLGTGNQRLPGYRLAERAGGG